jgi:hypothetical protein
MLLEPSSESFFQNKAIAVKNPYAIPLPDAGIKSCVTNARRRWLEARHTEEITYKP